MSSSARAAHPLGFALQAGSEATSGNIDPGGARPPVRVDVCVPSVGYADITLRSSGTAKIPDGRVVALHLDQIQVKARGGCNSYVSRR
jgi:hypothetical protein